MNGCWLFVAFSDALKKPPAEFVVSCVSPTVRHNACARNAFISLLMVQLTITEALLPGIFRHNHPLRNIRVSMWIDHSQVYKRLVLREILEN